MSLYSEATYNGDTPAHFGKMNDYVLVTPAHNEEAFIGRTLQSVVAQSVRPLRWIVVNDCSTDKTAEIVREYASRHSFIELLNVSRPPGRHFGNKVNAFNLGVARLHAYDYSYIGNLDADISVEERYFESLLAELQRNPRLGLSGGMVWSQSPIGFVSQQVALDSVAGAVQLFRRECFTAVGGLTPFPGGGEDSIAEIKARMNGWIVRTFPEYRVLEHRQTGTAKSGLLAARVREGSRFYSLGYSFPFYCVRCVRRVIERPRVIGSIAALAGYLSSVLKRSPVVAPPDVVRYLRAEQRRKLLALLRPGLLSRR